MTASISDIEATLRENAKEAQVKFVHSSWPVSLKIAETQYRDTDPTSEYPVKVIEMEIVNYVANYVLR
jgi:hypothetical protein